MKIAAPAALALLLLIGGVAAGQVADELSRRMALERYRAGQELMSAERYELAEREFSAAIQLDPLLTLAHYGLGQAFMAQARYASAVRAFIGCRDAFDTLASLHQRDRLTSERLLDEEMRELRDSVQRVRSGQIRGAGPAMLSRLESRLEELETMRKGRSADPFQTPAEVSLALGSAHYRNGQAQDAEREWLAAASANPRLGEAHNNLAALYAMTGRRAAAEDAVRAAERAGFRVHPQLKEDIRQMK